MTATLMGVGMLTATMALVAGVTWWQIWHQDRRDLHALNFEYNELCYRGGTGPPPQPRDPAGVRRIAGWKKGRSERLYEP
jgi:hypothetical protein